MVSPLFAVGLFIAFFFIPNVLSQWPPERGVTYDGYIETNGARRRYKVYAPGPNGAGYQTDCPGVTRFPLIFAFHGRGADAARMTDISGLNRKSVCAIVVVPFGMYGDATASEPGVAKRAWEPAKYATRVELKTDTTFTDNPPLLRDDKLFVRDIMDVLWTEYGNGIRWEQVYITGKSSGAGFVNHLACFMPERFAGIAPVAGPFVNPDPYRVTHEINKVCAFNHPMPVINFHGTTDEAVPYSGTTGSATHEGSWLPNVRRWANWWALKNGCRQYSSTRGTPGSGGQVLITHRWTTCPDFVEVRHYEIENGVHDWPSTTANADNIDPAPFRPSIIDATPLILNFLRGYSLPSRWFREITITAEITVQDDRTPTADTSGTYRWTPVPVCVNPFSMTREVKWVQTHGLEMRSELTLLLTFIPETTSVKVDWDLKMFEWTSGSGLPGAADNSVDDLDGMTNGSFVLAMNAATTTPMRAFVSNPYESRGDSVDLQFTVSNQVRAGSMRC